MDVYICIGSSCHLRGSYDVIQKLKEIVTRRRLEDRVKLSASFCLGRCTDGCTIQIDGEIITGVTKDNVEAILDRALEEKGE